MHPTPILASGKSLISAFRLADQHIIVGHAHDGIVDRVISVDVLQVGLHHLDTTDLLVANGGRELRSGEVDDVGWHLTRNESAWKANWERRGHAQDRGTANELSSIHDFIPSSAMAGQVKRMDMPPTTVAQYLSLHLLRRSSQLAITPRKRLTTQTHR